MTDVPEEKLTASEAQRIVEQRAGSFLGEMSRMVNEIESPPPPLTPQEKERIRQRERALLVEEIKREVLRELASRREDRLRYHRYLVSGIASVWTGVASVWAAGVFAALCVFAPERGIAHIEAHMGAPQGSEKWKAYWRGKSGERMQAQLRALYRRCRRD